MSETSVTQLSTRGQSAGALALGVVCMGIGHAMNQTGAFKFLFLVGTLFAVLGTGGLMEPRLLLGFTPEGRKAFPTWIHITSIALLLLAFAIGIGLLVGVYGIFS